MNLNDLPLWSPWPARLLGLSSWEIQDRTEEKVDSEYDKDKYAKCLAYYVKATAPVTIKAIRRLEYGSGSHRCISFKGDLLLLTADEVQSIYDRLLLYDTMRKEIEQSATIIELGCGYGYNLQMLEQPFQNKQFLGGEFSSNAVKLAAKLFTNVAKFNFYDSAYELIENAQPPITVFTSHAIEQLPKSAPFFQGLWPHRNKIKSVFHFEPVYELYDSTLLGLMRRRYAEVNDYNRDLLPELQQRNIQITRLEANVFGLNPLNPTSIIQWEYKT